MLRKKEVFSRALPWIKAGVSVAVIVFIIFKLGKRAEEIRAMIDLVWQRLDWFPCMLLIILMPVNWGLEVVKWHFIANRSVQLSWRAAISGVLNGLAMGFITPHAVGDYLGRIEQMPEGDKVEMGGMVMLSRVVQMSATFVFGLYGVVILMTPIKALFFGVAGLLVILSFLCIARLSAGSVRWPEVIVRFARPFKILEPKDTFIITVLAFVRYVVFGFQLAWAIFLFSGMSFQLAASGATWILLFKSIAPVFNFLSDLGIREASAVVFYDALHMDYLPVILASLLIWCINILLPTLAGALNILRSR